jgi:dihydroorotase (multifunctional complex type)
MTRPDLVVSGKLFVEGEFSDGAVMLRDERISDIIQISAIPSSAEHLDFEGLWILPGLVDVHVHLRDFEERSKEEFESGTKAAVAGGFSTVIAMPNTSPPLNSPQRLSDALRSAKGRVFCDVGFHCGLPQSGHDVDPMVSSGPFSMKLYPEDLSSLIGGKSGCRVDDLRRQDLTLYVHAEDEECLRTHRSAFADDLEGASEHGEIRPERCETSSIGKVLKSLGECDLHFAHITTAAGLEMLRSHIRSGEVTAEVTAHHLYKTEADARPLGGIAKVNPPLRKARDVEALRMGVNQGLVSAIVSDHAPHLLSQKRAKHYDEIPAGCPGIETTLGAVLKMAKHEQLGLVEALNCMTRNPCRRFGLGDAGNIGPGFLANLTVVDPKESWVVRPESFFSKAKYSLFDGEELLGKVMMTMVRGRIAYEDGYVANRPTGEVLRRCRS